MVSKIKIYKNFKILRKHQNAMILIGNFDGLHLGHQKLFKEAKKYKKKNKSKIGVVTFDPIPKMYFNKGITNYRLSNLNQKSKYFSDYNVDFLINKKLNRFEKFNQSVLCADDKIIWLCGLRIDDRVKISDETTKFISLKRRKRLVEQ